MATQEDRLLPNIPKSPREFVQDGGHDKPSSQTKHQLEGWPTSPKRVQSSLCSIITRLEVDLFLLACSLAFLAFGITVASYDQASTELHPSMTSAILEASKYGPSVFPILFACVVGRAAHAILVWRLEKGARVGTLDLLAASTSFTSTITSQLQMRILSFFGLILLVIWAMSPIGGRASIRQLTIGNKNFVQPASFTYMVPTSNLEALGASTESAPFGIVNTLLISSVLAPPATKLLPNFRKPRQI